MGLNRRTLIIVLVAAVGAVLVVPWAIRYLGSSSVIEIVNAEYGIPGRTCSAGDEIKQHVAMACGGFRPRCLVSVGSGWCGDPAPGQLKTLTIDYTCGATRKRASAADFTPLTLSCP